MQREASLQQRYNRLKKQLSTPNCFPYSSSVLNIESFVQENQTLYMKLLKQLKQLRKTSHDHLHKRQVKIKTTPFYLQNMMKSKSTCQEDQTLADLRGKNQLLRDNIAKVKEERLKKLAAEQPLLAEKRRILHRKRQEVDKLNQTSKQLKRANDRQDLLELYEQKCRECESLRVVNNDLSQELKKVILEINKVTGSEENPNMFLLSVGIR